MNLSFVLKLIPLAFLLIIMSVYLPSYADVIVTDDISSFKTAITTVGYREFKKEMKHSINYYKSNKPDTTKEKEGFINTFKDQLTKCNYFKKDVDNHLKRIEQLEAIKSKKIQDYIKNNPPPPPPDNPNDPSLRDYYKYEVPEGFDYSYETVDLNNTKETITEDEKILKQYLKELGVKDFSLPDKKELMLKNLVIISLLIIFLLFIGFTTLKYIRGKRIAKDKLKEE